MSGEAEKTEVSFDLLKMFHSIFETQKSELSFFRCKPFANLSNDASQACESESDNKVLNKTKTAA